MSGWLVAGLAVAALYGIHRSARWAEGRGWIYYRTKRMPPGAAGLAMMEVASVIQPQVEHVIEELTSAAARAEVDEAGEPLQN